LDRRDSGNASSRCRNDPADRQKETPMGPVLTILVVIVVVAAVVWFLRRA
jgi:hypothetical protein